MSIIVRGVFGQRVFAACLMSFLSGCVAANENYPTRWATLSPAIGGCSGITGSFRNAGEDADQRVSVPPLLSQYVIRGTPLGVYEIGKADLVDLSFGNDRILRIRAMSAGHLVAEQTYSERDSTLSCDKEGATLFLHSGIGTVKGTPVISYDSDILSLRRSTDGALVTKLSNQSIGIIFFIPAASSFSGWSRYLPM